METLPIRLRNEARVGSDRTHDNFAGEMGQVHTICLSGGQWPNCTMFQGILLIGINWQRCHQS